MAIIGVKEDYQNISFRERLFLDSLTTIRLSTLFIFSVYHWDRAKNNIARNFPLKSKKLVKYGDYLTIEVESKET